MIYFYKIFFFFKQSCRQEVSHRKDISRKWRSARIRAPDGNKRWVFRCVSFVPEKGAQEPVCVLCRECHHSCLRVTILT